MSDQDLDIWETLHDTLRSENAQLFKKVFENPKKLLSEVSTKLESSPPMV